MKIACQTLLWGSKIENIDDVLALIAESGFQGVEISQRLNREAGIPPSKDLEKLLQHYNLTLIGLGGGKLEERIAYAANIESFKGIYLYVEDLDLREGFTISKAQQEGFRVAIHPHSFRRPHNFDEAFKMILSHRNLLCVPDTAHAKITRDNIEDYFRKITPLDRIPAVHLKDWSPLYGRSSHNYAKGFTEFGKGKAPIGETLEILKKIGYQGWLVVEQDNSKYTPAESIQKNVEYLQSRNLPLEKKSDLKRFSYSQPPEKINSSISDAKQVEFYANMIKASSKNREDFFLDVAKEFKQISDSLYVSIWSPMIGKDWMSLLAIYPPPPPSPHVQYITKTRVGESISRDTLETKQVTPYDLAKQDNKGMSNNREFLIAVGVKHVLSIPVLNAFNPNHVLYLINLLCDRPVLESDFDQYARLASHVSILADRLMNDICAETAGHIDMFNPQPRTVADFIGELDDYIKKTFNCECVSTYLLNETNDKLISVSKNVEISWNGDHYYTLGEGVIGKLWKWRRFFLTPSLFTEYDWQHKPKSIEIVDSDNRDECLFGPIGVSAPLVLGIVKCMNKIGSGPRILSTMFTDDDVAILEAILQAAAPRLEMLMRYERHINVLKVVAESAVESLADTQELVKKSSMTVSEKQKAKTAVDYIEGLIGYGKCLVKLNADTVFPAIEKCHFYNDIIDPAIQSNLYIYKKDKHPENSIDFNKRAPDEWPHIQVDKNLFRQIFYVLFRNAIHNRVENQPIWIYIELHTVDVKHNGFYHMKVSNRGNPIPFEKIQQLFLGPGLNLSKTIAKLHGCDLYLKENVNQTEASPTIFELAMPTQLFLVAPRP